MGCTCAKTAAKEPGSKPDAPLRSSVPAKNPEKPVPAASASSKPKPNAVVSPPRPKSLYRPPVNPHIPVLSSDSLRLYHCQQKRWKPAIALTGQTVEVEGATMVFVTEQSLWVFEGFSRRVLEAAVATGVVTPLCELREQRSYSGAVLVDKAVLVFGGAAAPTAEKCTLAPPSAAPIANMLNARSRFVPCYYDDSVFLCGGCTVTAELYQIPENRYLLCSFSIPDASDCLALVSDSSLLVVSPEFLSRWDLLEEEMSVQSRAQKSDCCGPSALAGDFVYISTAGEVLRIDLKTTAHTVLQSDAVPSIVADR